MVEPDQDVNFSTIRALFVRRWKTVAATVIVGTSAVIAMTSLQPHQYEATLPLVLSGPPAPAGSSNASSVRVLLTGPALLEDIAKLEGDAGRRIEPADVFVDPVPNTAFVRLRVRDTDRARASRLAGLLAARGAEVSARLRTMPLEAMSGASDPRIEAARRALGQAESDLLEFRTRSQLEVLRKDLKSRLEQRTTALGLGLQITREQARLAAALEGLELHDEGGKGEGDREPSARQASRLLQEAFARAAAESRTRLAELEHARRQLAGTLKTGAIEPLQELYRRELELKRLEQEYDLARQVYAEEALRVRQGTGPALTSVPGIRVVEDSVAEAQPVPRERWRLIALAIVLSLLLGLALVIVLELAGTRGRGIQPV